VEAWCLLCFEIDLLVEIPCHWVVVDSLLYQGIDVPLGAKDIAALETRAIEISAEHIETMRYLGDVAHPTAW